MLFATALQASEPAVRFAAIDVFVDPQGKPLAAYQFELTAPDVVKLVGVEGGEHAAFAKAPYYDPRALQQHRIVIAGLSTETSLPSGRTRVARVHVQISGNSEPAYTVKLIVAGDRDAKAIKEAVASFAPVQSKQVEKEQLP